MVFSYARRITQTSAAGAALLGLATAAAGCVAESSEPSMDDIDAPAAAAVAHQGVNRAEGISAEARLVQKGNYNVMVLADTVPRSARDAVARLLRQEHGNEVLAWTVAEQDGPHHAFAYPRARYDTSGEREGKEDPRLKALRMALIDAVQSGSASRAAPSTCHTLYQYAIICSGKTFDSCGVQGTSSPTGRLASYGFDNYASCFFEWNTSNGVDVFDGNYQTEYIGAILDDWWQFNATFDNKASSLVNYY
ncbi:hypothetical protein BE21_19105 [Sorangium cellulosum]|uniref:Secreted protein n=1 Tax=Sorangium cellulosum TaxID=56 RepID=A0A150TX19_SORCE|nr:hypothetical protein BE21_19105 [Sorangium cellulosum]